MRKFKIVFITPTHFASIFCFRFTTILMNCIIFKIILKHESKCFIWRHNILIFIWWLLPTVLLVLALIDIIVFILVVIVAIIIVVSRMAMSLSSQPVNLDSACNLRVNSKSMTNTNWSQSMYLYSVNCEFFTLPALREECFFNKPVLQVKMWPVQLFSKFFKR